MYPVAYLTFLKKGTRKFANYTDFILSITRINEPDRAFTRLDVLKVRDQELCRTGTVYYTRQPCGRYDKNTKEPKERLDINALLKM